ncbi:MAG TPA: hypothetical protein VHQ91_04595 [Geminicoccaceae bacterium]|nr:hypothetical protein [Geminicoccaceae bacterium]
MLSNSRLAAPRLARGLLALTLAACQAPPAPPAARPSPPPVPTVGLGPPAAPPPAPVERELCEVLPAVLAGESDGFAGLRASHIAADSWRGAQTLPGTERCTIEGDAWPRARYVCASRRFGVANRDGAEAGFERLAQAIDECLSRPIWFPRNWERGEPFEFAMGERLLAWTDQSVSPPSQVVLKIQQDLDRRGYQLTLNLEAIH